MHKNLFSHIDIPAENINIPNGNAADLQAACRAYDEKIKSCGGIELFLGGVGGNGHIAFNEPGSPFDSPTRVVTLNQNTRTANARFFNNDINAVPQRAVSMGLGTIMAAREVIIMTTGLKKAEAVSRAIEGPRDINCSITVLQEHPNAYIVADSQAASLLSSSAHKRFGVCSFM
jgi:glucosamine-6-phosphate deaminase